MTSPAQTSIANTLSGGSAWEGIVGYARRNGHRIGTWVLPFLLVLYLGLKGGGYDAIVREQVGIAIWWIVLLGSALAILPATRFPRKGWIGLALLLAFTVWTGLGIAWSSDAGASVTEFARVATYLGVFVVVMSTRQAGDMRRLVDGLGGGLAVIGLLALLSRLHPSWFPTENPALVVGNTQNRLSYPLGYWNGLATLMAMAIPLLLYMAIRARTTLGRACAAAALPAVALTTFLTLSRGGAFEVVVALIVFVALAPRRLEAIPSLALSAIGSGILVIATSQRTALTDGLDTSVAHQQGNEILAMALVVCGGVGLLQAAVALAAKHRVGPRIRASRKTTITAWTAVALCSLVAALAAGLPGEISNRWEAFKAPGGAGSGVQRFDSSSGSGRYQTWSAAVDANEAHPVIGIGPGTFEGWWAQHRTIDVFVRDAHSLYLETLGEEGIVGLLLIAGFVLWILGVGVQRSVQGSPRRRWPYAAATASAFAFAVGAGIDWDWEIAVLPVSFMILAGSLLAPRRYAAPAGRQVWAIRALLIGLAVIALVVTIPPMLSANALRESRAAAASGHLPSALDHANRAHDLQPYAATPELQRALVLELLGKYEAALSPAREATRSASHNWQTWVVLSRLEAEAGRPEASVAAYERARKLNPRSQLFAAAEAPG
jgi:hypothetical protein